MREASRTGSVWLNFAVPATFGIVAAYCYWHALASRLEPEFFVQVQAAKNVGEVITAGDLAPVAMRGETAQLAAGILPWRHRGTAVGSRAGRRLRNGQLLLKSDLDVEQETDSLLPGEREQLLWIPADTLFDKLESGMQIVFQIQSRDGRSFDIGPYRLLEIMRAADSSRGGRGNVTQLKVAHIPYDDGSLDAELERLIQILQVQRNGGQGNSRLYSILPHRHSPLTGGGSSISDDTN